MAKIELKADLVRGTNYRFHVVDFQGTDIAIGAGGTTITSTTTDFTAASETAGINKRAVVVGDRIKVSNTANAANEGVELEVTAVAANSLTTTVVSGAPTAEAAGADINITAFDKAFEFMEAGGLSFIDGVAAITWASKVVDEWEANDLDIYDKMFTSIEPRAKSLAVLNGWAPFNNDTLKALRDMAMEVRDTATSAARRVYFNARSGNLDAPTDQFFFWPATDAELDPPVAAVTQGFINELILLVDNDNGIDNRGTWTFRCLEPGKTQLQEPIDIQFAEIIPVGSGNALDPKLADGVGALLVPDTTVAAGGIYANITANVDADSLYDGDVDGVLYSFTGFVDHDLQTNEAVHTKIHYLLRQPVNINTDGTGPTIRGDKAPPITSFLGEVFFLDKFYPLNFATIQRNELRATDLSGATRQYPSIFTLTITAPTIAIGGTASLMHEDTFGASNPTYVEDEGAVVQKDFPIAATVSIVIAYSTYAVDGHTAGTPIPMVLTFNRPNFIEPDNQSFIMGASNRTENIAPTPDPSYSAT